MKKFTPKRLETLTKDLSKGVQAEDSNKSGNYLSAEIASTSISTPFLQDPFIRGLVDQGGAVAFILALAQ